MKELTENHNIIIFIDELHTLVGAGSAEGSLDAANILKPALSRGELQCIGATTPTEYRKHIEKDRSLERRFQAVKVSPPTEEETIEILRGIKERYEKFHNVRLRRRGPRGRGLPVEPLHPRPLPAGQGHRPARRGRQPGQAARDRGALGRARVLAPGPGGGRRRRPRRRGGRLLPRRAARRPATTVQTVTRALVGSAATGALEVTKADIDEVVSQLDRHPHHRPEGGGVEKLLRMEEELHRRIVSQDAAHQRRGPGHPTHPRRAQEPATGRWARSCSSGPPASARPRWPAGSPRSCSAASAAWSASTCPSTWRSTR